MPLFDPSDTGRAPRAQSALDRQRLLAQDPNAEIIKAIAALNNAGSRGTDISAGASQRSNSLRDTIRNTLLTGSQRTTTSAPGVAPTSVAVPPGADGIRQAITQAAEARGWSGAETNALLEIVRRESSFNPAAKNPNSTAFGLFQFLDGTWRNYGTTRQTDPAQQIDLGLRYIADRYGTPSKALAFHNQKNWY